MTRSIDGLAFFEFFAARFAVTAVGAPRRARLALVCREDHAHGLASFETLLPRAKSAIRAQWGARALRQRRLVCFSSPVKMQNFWKIENAKNQSETSKS